MEPSRRVPPGDPVQLTSKESALADEVQKRLDALMTRIRSGAHDVKESEINEMGQLAHKLHILLKERGHEPKHHKYMLRNRELPSTHSDFYKHVHPVEDLLRFIQNEHANDDPVDRTIGHEFDFRIYSRRWRHEDTYRVERVSSGWSFTSMNEIKAGRDARVGGKPGTGLFHLLDHDSINYPEELPGYFEWLWEQAAERGLTHEEVQAAITQLAGWVTSCEKASPDGIFKGYK